MKTMFDIEDGGKVEMNEKEDRKKKLTNREERKKTKRKGLAWREEEKQKTNEIRDSSILIGDFLPIELSTNNYIYMYILIFKIHE